MGCLWWDKAVLFVVREQLLISWHFMASQRIVLCTTSPLHSFPVGSNNASLCNEQKQIEFMIILLILGRLSIHPDMHVPPQIMEACNLVWQVNPEIVSSGQQSTYPAMDFACLQTTHL